MNEINSDPYRIALALMQLHKCTYEEAQNKLLELKLNIFGGELLKTSVSLQASILTSVNCGVRAFKGGVFLKIPNDIPLLLNIEGYKTLNDLVKSYGASVCDELDKKILTLKFGIDPLAENEIGVVSTGWKAGICVHDEIINLSSQPDFAPGGIAAGSLAIGFAFLKLTNLDPLCFNHSIGISLWRPDLDWRESES